MIETVKMKKLRENAIAPSHGSQYAAGYDLYSCLDNDVVIEPGKTVLIPTGWAMSIPKDKVVYIYARSGLACKQGLRLANSVGVIDADYRGEYMVALHNDSNESRTIKHGERIAQMVLAPYYLMNFMQVDDLDETNRGAGGFGSTGV